MQGNNKKVTILLDDPDGGAREYDVRMGEKEGMKYEAVKATDLRIGFSYDVGTIDFDRPKKEVERYEPADPLFTRWEEILRKVADKSLGR